MVRTKTRRLPVVLLVGAIAVATGSVSWTVAARAQSQALSCGCRDGIEDFGHRFHSHDRPATAVPRSVGQDTLAAVQEVVALLLTDSQTDWNEVRITRLREHLVDLEQIMQHADVAERELPDGLEVRVTGDARTLAALERQIPAHVERMQGFRGWVVQSEELDDGLRLVMTSASPDEVPVLRALGFFGLVASGVHRPHELLAVARGGDAAR